MNIIITGAKGQLGSDCQTVFSNSHSVTAFTRKDLDITRISELEARIVSLQPDVIVNCAAFTRVDDCETEMDVAWNINVTGPENLAQLSKNCGAKLIHISTDYVFDGRKPAPEPYREDDKTGPVSYYGRTKLEGEAVVRRITRRHAIVRTAWLYGKQGSNFLKTMLRIALADPLKPIRVVNDQYSCPTWSYRLALQIARLIEMDGEGTYHAVCHGHCSWYDLAGYFLREMGVLHTLVPIPTSQYPTPATRPKNSILENRRLREDGIDVMGHWTKSVDEFISLYRDELMRECIAEPV